MQTRLLTHEGWRGKKSYQFMVFTPVENPEECTIENSGVDNRWVYYLDGKPHKSITGKTIPAVVIPRILDIWTSEWELEKRGYKKYNLMHSKLMTREEAYSYGENDIVEAPYFTAGENNKVA